MKQFFTFLFLVTLCSYPVASLAQGDVFENDDTIEFASLVFVRNELVKGRTFHDAGDEDWFRFAVRGGSFYEITIKQVGPSADPVLTLSGLDKDTVERVVDDGANGDDEIFSFQAEADGIYFAKVHNYDPQVAGATIRYTLSVFEPVGAFGGQTWRFSSRQII